MEGKIEGNESKHNIQLTKSRSANRIESNPASQQGLKSERDLRPKSLMAFRYGHRAVAAPRTVRVRERENREVVSLAHHSALLSHAMWTKRWILFSFVSWSHFRVKGEGASGGIVLSCKVIICLSLCKCRA